MDGKQQRYFVACCAVVWNSLPSALQVSSLTVTTFVRHLKAYLFSCLNWRILKLFIWRYRNMHIIIVSEMFSKYYCYYSVTEGNFQFIVVYAADIEDNKMYSNASDHTISSNLQRPSDSPRYQVCLSLMTAPSTPLKQLLWPPYGIGQAIICLPCGFFYLLSSFFLA